MVTHPRTIVSLGGGVGGVVAARELRRRLPRPHRIVLVDREREHLFAPSLLWLMVGQRKAASIRRPLSRLERKGIEVRIGEVEHIDPGTRQVTLAGGGGPPPPSPARGGGAAGGAPRPPRPPAGVVGPPPPPAYKCPAAPYEAAM